MSHVIEVHAPGSFVGIHPTSSHEVIARVLAVQLRADGVTYRVAWWDGTNRRDEWVDAIEVVAVGNPTKRVIGFKGTTHGG